MPSSDRVWTYTYDGLDREIQAQDPNGFVTSRTYDATGNVTTVIDAEGNSVRTVYDDANRAEYVMAVLFEDGHGATADRTVASDVTHEWASASQVITVLANTYTNGFLTTTREGDTSAADGQDRRTTTLTFGDDGRIETSSTGGRTSTFTYDPIGNVTQLLTSGTDGYESSATSSQVSTTYNAAGLPTETRTANDGTDLVTLATYDQRGLLVEAVSPRGSEPGANPTDFTTSTDYDQLGRPVRVQQPATDVAYAGATTNIDSSWVATNLRPETGIGYDGFGDQTHVTTANGDTTVTVYDGLGRRIGVTHPDYVTPLGNTLTATESWTYTPNSNVDIYTDRAGDVTAYTYDDANRPVGVVEAAIPQPGNDPALQAPGESFTYYDWAGRTTGNVDPTGAAADYAYDSFGRLRSETVTVRAAGAQPAMTSLATFGYSWLGFATSQTDAAVTSYATFNSHGDVVTSRRGSLADTTYQYDGLGRIRHVINRDATTDTYTYDQAGRRLATAFHDSNGTLVSTTSVTYDADGNAIGSTTPRGHETTVGYDPLGRMTSMTVPVAAGHDITTGYTYDANGNNTSVTDGDGNTTRYIYNAYNLRSHILEPAAGSEPETDRVYVATYDEAGLAIVEQQPGGRIGNRTFNAMGLPETETWSEPSVPGTMKTFGYDQAGRTVWASSPAGPISFTYDDRSLLVETSGAGYSFTTSHDAAGREISRSDAAGSWASTYTANDQLDTTVETGGGGWSTDRTFDPATGYLTGETYDGGGQRAYTYDPAGRVVGDTVTDNTSQVTASQSYVWDCEGQLIHRDLDLPGDPGSGEHGYTYDWAGRLTSWDHQTTVAAGPLCPGSQGPPNSTKTVTVEANTWWLSPEYELQVNGQTVDGSRTVTTGGSSWQYDTFDVPATTTINDLLVNHTTTDSSALRVGYVEIDGYQYQASSTEVSKQGDYARGCSTVFNDQQDFLNCPGYFDFAAVTSQGSGPGGGSGSTADPTPSGEIYTYDNRGNRLTAGSRAFTYDNRNRLLTDPDGSYTWSAAGAMQVFTPNNSGPVRDYVHDAGNRLASISDGVTTVDYDYDALDRVIDRDGDGFTYTGFSLDPSADGTATYARTGGGFLLNHQTTGSGARYPLTNTHNDLIGLLEGDGTLGGSKTFNPFGEVDSSTGEPSLLGYQGDWTDPDTDNVWMGARWYQPSSATFLTRDAYAGELSTPFSLNRYTYGLNNPLRYWDPTGRFAIIEPFSTWTKGSFTKIRSYAKARTVTKKAVAPIARASTVIEPVSTSNWAPAPSSWRAVTPIATASTVVEPTTWSSWSAPPPSWSAPAPTPKQAGLPKVYETKYVAPKPKPKAATPASTTTRDTIVANTETSNSGDDLVFISTNELVPGYTIESAGSVTRADGSVVGGYWVTDSGARAPCETACGLILAGTGALLAAPLFAWAAGAAGLGSFGTAAVAGFGSGATEAAIRQEVTTGTINPWIVLQDATIGLAFAGGGQKVGSLYRRWRASRSVATSTIAPRPVPASTFRRTEALSGRPSSRQVTEMAEEMAASGWNGPPIKAVDIGDSLYVVDGHHRLAAARLAGIEVPYEVVDPATVIGPGQWSSVDDILGDSFSVGRDRLRGRR